MEIEKTGGICERCLPEKRRQIGDRSCGVSTMKVKTEISSMLLRFLTWSPGGMLSRMGELKNLKRNPPFWKSPLTFLKEWLAKIYFFLWVCNFTRADAKPFFFNALSKSLCGFFIIRGPFDPIKPIKTPSEAFTLDL